MRHPKDVDEWSREQTPEGVARYIAALTEELADIAKRNGFDALGYILDMARMEAEQVSKGYRAAA